MSNHTVVIFTANSNTGNAAVGYLRKNFPDIKVRAILRDATLKTETDVVSELKDLDCEIIHGDIKKPKALGPVFKDAKAAYFSVPATKDRAQLGKNFIDACFEHGVEYGVIISVLGADKKATLYHKQFAEIEEYASEKAGKPVKVAVGDRGKRLFKPVILRSAQFYQNFYGSLPSLSQNVLYMPLGEHDKLVHVDAADVGKAIAHIVANPEPHGNKTYNLIGERQIGSILAASITMKAGVECTYERVDDHVAEIAYNRIGLQQWIAAGNVEMIKFIREGGIDDVSDGDFETITGSKPSRFQAFVKEYLKPLLDK